MQLYAFYILCVVLPLILPNLSVCRELKIAWLVPAASHHGLNASSSVGGLKLALHKLTHSSSELLANHTIRVKWFNSFCNTKSALRAAVEAHTNFKADVFLGPVCPSAMKVVSLMASVWNKPVFGWVSNDVEFHNRTTYSTLIRMLGTSNRIPKIVCYISEMFKWKRYSLIHDSDTPFTDLANAIRKIETISIRSTHVVSDLINEEQIANMFMEIKKVSRILIFAVPWKTLRVYMVVAHRLGMSNGEYAFICIHGDVIRYNLLWGSLRLINREDHKVGYLFTWEQFDKQVLSSRVWRHDNLHDSGARRAFESVLHITTAIMKEDLYEKFIRLVKDVPNTKNELWDLPSPTEPDAYSSFLYDATMVWALAVNKLLEENIDPSNGSHLFKTALEMPSTNGITGRIEFDENGNRLWDFLLLDMQPNGRFRKIMELEFTNSSIRMKYNESHLLYWPNGKTGIQNAPPDIPVCGFENENCKHDLTDVIIVSSVAAIFLIVITLVISICVRRYRRSHFLNSMLWQVDFQDIHQMAEADFQGAIAKNYVPTTPKKKISNSSSVFEEYFSFPFSSGNKFGSVGFLKGNFVAVKKVDQGIIQLNDKIVNELNQLMTLKHQNVCSFLGAAYEPEQTVLLWEYCSKGSLQDVIRNQNINLDQMFMFALGLDITKGLEFIHRSTVNFHGNLKSSNCVIDNRWTCKLTDFGLPSIRSVVGTIKGESDNKLFWTAPEILRNETFIDKQKADMFSLGIILKEIFTRSEPYSEYSFLLPADIYRKLKEGADGVIFRPVFSDEFRSANEHLVSFIENLWNNNLIQRPSTTKAWKLLHKINPYKHLTVIDNIIVFLEKYSNNLEKLTKELDEEKKKTEHLLYRMLPRSVAEDLKLGKHVKAELFDDATIFFSDIVGFTTICANISPIEVVDFLNDLYTTFDAVITNYDVYKVETIGDAYMLASGLPNRNGSRHVREIADSALHIMKAIKTITIPNHTNQRIQIRIGIHSGSVVAGVVGIAMPRYCLFGDTVNTASRMESTGCPMHIHLSPVAAEKLRKYDNYSIKCRGEITVKGKGVMKTYFLYKNSEHHHIKLSDNDKAIPEHSGKIMTIGNSNSEMTF